MPEVSASHPLQADKSLIRSEIRRQSPIGNGDASWNWKLNWRPLGTYLFGALVNTGIVTALAAVCGSLVGGLCSSIGTWITQKHQGHRELLERKIVRREALYSDFIVESARLLVDAMGHNAGDPQKLVSVFALLSRMRLSSSIRVLETAEEVIRTIVSTYRQPNLTVEQIETRAVNGEGPLRKFSNICRAELDSLRQYL